MPITKLSCVVLLCIFISVDGIQMSISATKKTVGSGPLTLTCRATASDAVNHYTLAILRNTSNSGMSGIYHQLVSVNNKGVTWTSHGDQFKKTTHAEVTTGSISDNLSTLEIDVPDYECSDAGTYKCVLTGSTNQYVIIDPPPTATASVAIIAQDGNLTLSLETHQKPGTSFPMDFNDPQNNFRQTSERSFEPGTLLKFKCEGELSKPTRLGDQNNRLKWYILRAGTQVFVSFDGNRERGDVITNSIPRSSRDSCLQIHQSEMTYNVTYREDVGGTSFHCKATSDGGGLSDPSNEIQIYGVHDVNNPGGQTDDEPSNAGMIAGIVVGVLAAIVLIILLVVFLVYRNRNSGETYATKEDTPANGRQEAPRPTGNDKVYTVPMKDRNKEISHPPRQGDPYDYTYSQVNKVNRTRIPDSHTRDNMDKPRNKDYMDKPTHGYGPEKQELHYAALDITTNPPKSPRAVKPKQSPTEYTEIQF